MVTSMLRLLCVLSVLISPTNAESPELPADCGRLLNAAYFRYAIYVHCPALPQLSAEQAQSLVMALLDGTDRPAGHTMIVFVQDESLFDRDRQRVRSGWLISDWGDDLVGVYLTQSQLLTVRSAEDEGWREIYLPTARE